MKINKNRKRLTYDQINKNKYQKTAQLLNKYN